MNGPIGLTVGGEFDGIGLLAYGLHLAGLRHAWLCEVDPWRRSILELRFPGVPVYPDVRRIGGALPKLSNEQFEEAVGLYNGGMSVEGVAERFPVTRQALWERMKNAGVEMRPRLRHGAENHFYRGGSLGEDWAHNKVEKALARGELVRPEFCEECGGPGEPYKDGRSPIQAHHDDYNEPLRVRWLCQRCHHNWHKHNTPVALRDEPVGGDANGSLFEVEPVDVLVGGFPLDRARAPRPPENAKGSDTPRPFCGERCGAALASYDPATCSLRTSQTSLLSTEEESGERFSGTWPRSGSMSRGIVFPLRPSAPLIDVIGSSPLLGTPTSHPRTHTPRPVDHGAQLANDLVKLLPTPMARTNGGTEVSSASREGGLMLEETIKLLPTPRERDWKGRGFEDGLVNTLERVAASRSTGESSSPPSDGGSASTALRLSPCFEEWMMGAPAGWSNPDCPLSATEFRSRWGSSPGDTSSTASESE